MRQATDQTPAWLLERLRLERAGDWLLTEDLPLADIARRTGFCDAFHFSRRFKRFAGCPPLEYRQRFRGWWR